MKRKIIALLMATVCTTAVFASCDGGESSVPSVDNSACETHVDANNDGACDNCNQKVVVIIEQLPAEKEQEIPMVVNPLPENVKMSDYIGPKAEDAKTFLPKDALVVDLENVEKNGRNLFVYRETKSEKDSNYRANVHTDPDLDDWREIESVTIKIYDVVTNTVVFEKTSNIRYQHYKWNDVTATDPEPVTKGSPEDFDEYKTYNVKFFDAYVKLVECTREKEDDGDTKTTYKTEYYTYDWTLIATSKELYEPSDNAVDVAQYGDYYYVTVEGTTYTIDAETMQLVTLEGATADANMHIRRPAFDEVIGNYGYVLSYNKVMVYDLTKWISCIYVYDYPSYWNNAQTVLLENGTLFVQYEKTLHSSAVSYDYIDDNDNKIDLVQALINPVTGEIKKVEFGYKLATAGGNFEKYNDNAKNIVCLSPIEDKEVNTNATFEAVIDNELNILYAHKPTLVGQEDFLLYLADGYYGTVVKYDNNVQVNVVVDGEGKEVTKVPTNAYVECGMIKVGYKYYSFDMSKVLLDLMPSETELNYDVVAINDNYMILSQTTEDDPLTEDVDEEKVEYFYFNGAMEAPAKITVENFESIRVVSEDYFYVTTKKEVTLDKDNDGTAESTEEVYEYVLYNANNEKVATFESCPTAIVEYSVEGVYVVSFDEGAVLIK